MIEQFGLSPTTAKAILPGDKFGRITVLATGQKGKYKYYAVCQCECGSPIKPIRFDGLKAGIVVSCGCFHKERTTTHGKTGHIHHNRWLSIIDRCDNPQSTAYHNYGGRGISICERWRDFNAFLEDIPPGYFAGAHIDRIDNDGDYEPGNVRWVTPLSNHNNRRVTKRFEFAGENLTLHEWSLRTGVNPKLLWDRLKNGWSIERTLTTPKLSHQEAGRRARAAQIAAKSARSKTGA